MAFLAQREGMGYVKPQNPKVEENYNCRLPKIRKYICFLGMVEHGIKGFTTLLNPIIELCEVVWA